ncbi:unnamed protein product [Mytilus coruscus]|uniref:Uncharacterized protein n=1 Tax=Mytilus coruscus TaxID=42192 RepID=A0A6J8DK71_MYTCO|nr:unnamed protein product [Mytilus coruscus]
MPSIRTVLLLILVILKVSCNCDPNNGPVGEPECVQLNGYIGTQWATCLTDDYIQSNSFGTIKCMDRQANYCYYQCMVEVHGKNDGLVTPNCHCDGFTKYNNTVRTDLPSWCFSPSLDDCRWIGECLQKQYRCTGYLGKSYAMEFTQNVCQAYADHYPRFSLDGGKWMNGVRKCLQSKLVPFLRPWMKATCNTINLRALQSQYKCLYVPGMGLPSICNITSEDLWSLFWTLQENMRESEIHYYSLFNLLTAALSCEEHMHRLDTLEIMKFQVNKRTFSNKYQLTEYEKYDISRKVTKFISREMKWQETGISLYTFVEGYQAQTNSYNVVCNVTIIITSKSIYDFNDQKSVPQNLSDELRKLLKHIQKRDIPNTTNRLTFSYFYLCESFNCSQPLKSEEICNQRTPAESIATAITYLAYLGGIAILIIIAGVSIKKFKKNRLSKNRNQTNIIAVVARVDI